MYCIIKKSREAQGKQELSVTQMILKLIVMFFFRNVFKIIVHNCTYIV